ncbi:MAG: DEAD/DEAH box helicase [Planctomycetaceae bacterium]
MDQSVVPSSSASSSSSAPPADSFAGLGLCPTLLAAVTAEGYTVPTPIQARAIPHVLAGRDLFGCAQTGTGKTAAFALPILERFVQDRRPRTARRCRCLVLAPTRELAGQIHEAFRAYGRGTGTTTALVYGGVGQSPQAAALRPGVDVLVATPGRLLDLVGQKLVDLRGVEVLVLDEADRMLDMGFIHDVRRIVSLLPRERQTLLFSATLPGEVRQLAADLLRTPLEVKTAPQATPAETVAQSVCFVTRAEKRPLLVGFLRQADRGRVIVFTRTKRGADRLHRELDRAGIDAAAIHGDKSQQQRERALAAFKGPRPPVLIATDIAARGIDVDQVSHVVNYELPHEPETYVHRIGRTGRAGHRGAAVSFCDHEERPRLAAIEKLLRRSLPPCDDLPTMPGDPRADGGEPAGDDVPRARSPRAPRAGSGRAPRGAVGGRRTGGGVAKGPGRRGRGAGRTAARPAPAIEPAAPPSAPVPPSGKGRGVTRRYRRAL